MADISDKKADSGLCGDVVITDSAARRIAAVAAQRGVSGRMLRVTVEGGGCQGFSYVFAFDDSRREDDRIFDHGAARVVIDEASLGLMGGARIDFVEDLIGARFQIDNPQASSSCGCGTSFSL